MRDSDLFDSWKDGKKEEEKVLQNTDNVKKIQILKLELGKLRIPEKDNSLVTGEQNDKLSIHRAESTCNLVCAE